MIRRYPVFNKFGVRFDVDEQTGNIPHDELVLENIKTPLQTVNSIEDFQVASTSIQSDQDSDFSVSSCDEVRVLGERTNKVKVHSTPKQKYKNIRKKGKENRESDDALFADISKVVEKSSAKRRKVRKARTIRKKIELEGATPTAIKSLLRLKEKEPLKRKV